MIKQIKLKAPKPNLPLINLDLLMNRLNHNLKYLIKTLFTATGIDFAGLRSKKRSLRQDELVRLNASLSTSALSAANDTRLTGNRPVVYRKAASNFPLVRDLSVDQLMNIVGDNGHESSTVKSFYYGNKPVKFFPLFQACPELLDFIDLNWIYEHVRPKPAIDQGFQFFASHKKGGVTHFHNANDSNLFFQLSGKKRWIIFDAKHSHLFRPAVSKGEYRIPEDEVLQNLDVFDGLITPDLGRKPYVDVTLEAGDVLYVPPFAWHSVKNISDNSLAVAYRWLSPVHCLTTSSFYFLLDCLAVNPPIWKSISMARRDFRQIFVHQSDQPRIAKRIYNKRTTRLTNNYSKYLSSTKHLMRKNCIF